MGRRRKPQPPAARVPRCIKCDAAMTVAKVEPMQAEGLRYELRTFQCPDCGRQQTYTMGLAELTRCTL